MSKLSVSLEGDTTIVIERFFAAPPEAVFRAHTEPALIQQWMLGPDGWTMPACRCDPRPGGEMRYEWSDGSGGGFHLTGEFIELDPPHRIVHVERMFLPHQTPDNRIVTTFTAVDGGTQMVARMSVPDAATRKAMLDSGMTDGMKISYARLETLL